MTGKGQDTMGVLGKDPCLVLKIEEESQGHFLSIDLKDIGEGGDGVGRISDRAHRSSDNSEAL